jgi:hypothetical protein
VADYLPSVSCAPAQSGPEPNMDMRFDHLLGAVTYAALAIAALAGAWLLADLLGGAVTGTFPTVPSRLFG